MAVSTLSDIMSTHGREDWYKTHWTSGDVSRIATEIATIEDTDRDNLRSRLQAHPTIAPLLRAVRIQPTAPVVGPMSPEEDAVYRAAQALTFYHVTEHHAGVRETGLDPDRGGRAGGFAAERSTPGQRAKNIAGSRNKVFVTRSQAEVSQYAAGHPEHVVRVMVPDVDQAGFQTDPDSQFGLSHTMHLTHTDTPSRQLDWMGYAYVAKKLGDAGQNAARDNLSTIYTGLAQRGAFGATRVEPERRLPGPVETMSDEEITAALLRKFGPTGL